MEITDEQQKAYDANARNLQKQLEEAYPMLDWLVPGLMGAFDFEEGTEEDLHRFRVLARIEVYGEGLMCDTEVSESMMFCDSENPLGHIAHQVTNAMVRAILKSKVRPTQRYWLENMKDRGDAPKT